MTRTLSITFAALCIGLACDPQQGAQQPADAPSPSLASTLVEAPPKPRVATVAHAPVAANDERSPIIRQYYRCVERCSEAAERETDRATCQLQCAYDVAPDPTVDGAQATRECLGELAHCMAPCDEANDRETNAATCRLRCESEAEHCLGSLDS